jgi:hypothetical protein
MNVKEKEKMKKDLRVFSKDLKMKSLEDCSKYDPELGFELEPGLE